jgi:oligopeptide/dipeptide ABC transporter ATP-binding protein
MIAMALSCDPNFLIADEPTTALDVTIEAQILNLMRELQSEFNMSIMIITHDLGVIGEMADRVIVMYTGKVVEKATTDDIFYNPKHPYTKGLLKSIPKIGIKGRLAPIKGSVPNLLMLPEGCYFEPRCEYAKKICKTKEPPMFKIDEKHAVKCWLYNGREEI